MSLVLCGEPLLLNAPNEPEAATGTVKLWCLGDSLTEGSISGSFPSPGGGYRSPLRTLLAGQGRTVEFVGTIVGGDTPATNHDGHSGYRVEVLRESVPAWQETLEPDLVLLMAGTNNVAPPSGIIMKSRLMAAHHLLRMADEIQEGPGTPALAIMAIPQIYAVGYRSDVQGIITQYNQILRSGVESRRASRRIAYVDVGLQSADMSDGVHPNTAGYLKMAYAWLQAVPYLLGVAA